MSVITNYILLPYSLETDEHVFQLNRLLRIEGQGSGFTSVHHDAGGPKVMADPVWLLSANYFGPERMVALMAGVPWEFNVQLLVNAEQEGADCWRLVTVTGQKGWP